MALIPCTECQTEISDKAKTCPKCGVKIKKSGRKRKAFFAFSCVIVGLGVIGSFMDDQDGSSIPDSTWSLSSKKNELTGKTQYQVVTKKFNPVTKMDFPYHDVQSWLIIGCVGNSGYMSIGFSTPPNLNNGTPQDGGFSTAQIKVKAGDGAPVDMTVNQKWGDRFLTVDSAQRNQLWEAMSTVDTLVIQYNWHGSPSVQFKYDVRGQLKATERVLAECAKSA